MSEDNRIYTCDPRAGCMVMIRQLKHENEDRKQELENMRKLQISTLVGVLFTFISAFASVLIALARQ